MVPVALVPCRAPARARRIGGVPTPRVRPLAEVLPAHPRAPAVVGSDAGERTRRAQDELDRIAAALRPLAARLLTAVADVLAGRRPPGNLGPLLAPEALATLVRAVPRSRPAGTRRTSSARSPAAGLRGVRVCAVGPRAVEVVAVVHGHDRVRALAARLERSDDGRADPAADPGRWRAVALWPG